MSSWSSSYLILLLNTKEATHVSRNVNLPNCDFYTSFSKKQGRKTRFLNQCIAAASWQSTGHKSAHLQWTGKENKAKNWSRPNWVQWCRKVKLFGDAGCKGWAECDPLGWNRVNFSAKYWGGGTVPPGPPVPASMESMQPELYRWASFASCSSHTNGFITLALGKPGRAPSRTFCRKKLWYSRICSFSFGLHQSADDGFDAHSGSGPCPLACLQPTN